MLTAHILVPTAASKLMQCSLLSKYTCRGLRVSPRLTRPISIPSLLRKRASNDNRAGHPLFDYTALVDNIPELEQNAVLRKYYVRDLHELPLVVRERKEVAAKLAEVQHRRKKLADLIAQTKGKDPAKAEHIEQARAIREEAAALQGLQDQHQARMIELALRIPNFTHPDAPIGPEENARLILTAGPSPLHASADHDHVKISTALDLVDFGSGTLVTGSSWYYLNSEAAALEHALVNYALSTAASKGWSIVTPPDVVKEHVAWRCGFQPREDEAGQTYSLHTPNEHSNPGDARYSEALVLAGTAEIPLGGMFAFRTFEQEDLPLRVVGVGKAYRVEAGARGADTRGLYRVHQFTKVELFAVAEEETSEVMMEEMLGLQREIVDGLGIPYRVLDMPSEELGASAYRKYDIEAWMPGRGSWGEISSLSNCTSYQSRRLCIRYTVDQPEDNVPAGHTEKRFAHTLNGTAAAIPRLIVALLENGVVFGEAEEGKEREAVALRLPVCLRRFWIGSEERIQWVENFEGLGLPEEVG